MSEIHDLLWLKAQEFGEKASAKENEWQMIKSAAITSLGSRGIDSADAEDLLEKLAEKANPNLKEDLEKVAQQKEISDILEKAARYVTELEVKLDNKEEEINGLQKAAQAASVAPSVDALTGTGAFSDEDLDNLTQLDNDTLSKVASLADKTPWNLGSPSERTSASGQDALTEFLLS